MFVNSETAAAVRFRGAGIAKEIGVGSLESTHGGIPGGLLGLRISVGHNGLAVNRGKRPRGAAERGGVVAMLDDHDAGAGLELLGAMERGLSRSGGMRPGADRERFAEVVHAALSQRERLAAKPAVKALPEKSQQKQGSRGRYET